MNLIQTGRCFFGIGIAGMGVQQCQYSDFRPMILSYWPPLLPGLTIAAWIVGIGLVLAGILIVLNKNARPVSLALGIFFFVLFIVSHVYYQLFQSPHSHHLGSWTNPLKELAFAGSSFILTASYSKDSPYANDPLWLTAGRIFFSLMLIVFGIDHFLYNEFVATLVPRWIPGDMFWTYFGAVMLIGSGLCILLKIQIRLVSLLLAIMLFLWLILLHIPRAIATPDMAQGNEITSVFQCLAFSGVALVLYVIYQGRHRSAGVNV